MTTRIFLRNILLFFIFVITPFVVFYQLILLPGFWGFKVHLLTMDTLISRYPFLQYFYDELRNGRFPFWCPSVAGGIPILAQIRLGLFYPLNLIDLFITPSAGILPLAFLHYSLGSFFFYLYARKIKLTRPASIAGAFIFVFNDFTILRFSTLSDLNTMIWLPLLLYFLEDGVVGENRMIINYRAAVAAGCVLGIQILAGYLVYVYLTMIMASIYFVLLWRRVRSYGHSFVSAVSLLGAFYGIFFIFGLGVGSIALIPFCEQFFSLARMDLSFTDVYRMNGMTFNYSNIFDLTRILFNKIGYIPFVLSFLLLYPVKKTFFREYRLFYIFLIFLLLILILSDISLLGCFLLDHLPVSFFKMIKKVDRLRFLFYFSLAVLIGIKISAIDKIGQMKQSPRWRFLQVCLPLSIFVLLFIYFLNSYKLYLKIYPHDIKPQVVSYLKSHTDSWDRTYYGLSNQWLSLGINLCSARSLLLSKQYFQFTGADIRRSLIAEDDSFIDFLAYPNLVDTLGCKYIVLSKKHKPVDYYRDSKWLTSKSYFEKAYEDSDFEVYLNKHVLPRAVFYTKWQNARNHEEAFNVLMRQDFDAHRSVVVENNDYIITKTQEVASFTKIIKYSDNEVVILVQSVNPGWLVLFDMNYPGWRVYVDGQQKDIYNADFLFRGVFLKSGEHYIKFVYYPLVVIIGLFLTVFTIGLAIFILIKKKEAFCRVIVSPLIR